MAKAPGGYVPLNMNYMRDPDIRRAGADAEHLYIRSLAHAKAGNTDGFIGDFDLELVAVGMKQVARRVASLVEVGLWITVKGGWEIRNWAKWNMTRDEIRDDKSKKRDAAIATNHQRWHVEKGQIDRNCKHCEPTDVSLHRSTKRSTERVASASLSEVKRSEVKGSEVKVGSDVAIAMPPAGATSAQTLIGEWVSHCEERPPGRVIGQVSKEIKTMLDEGIDYERVRSGLAEWNRKGLHPSTLASVVHEIANKKPKLSTTDQRVADGIALTQRYLAEEAAQETQLQIGQSK